MVNVAKIFLKLLLIMDGRGGEDILGTRFSKTLNQHLRDTFSLRYLIFGLTGESKLLGSCDGDKSLSNKSRTPIKWMIPLDHSAFLMIILLYLTDFDRIGRICTELDRIKRNGTG